MDIDPDISHWILDFLLRQPLEDRTVSTLLRILPLPNDKPNLKISLLLRKLQSEVSHNLISESALEILEQLEELVFGLGIGEVLEAMKHAYCAVAVECTVKCLRDGSGGDDDTKFKFFEAVKRVWRGRVGRMEKLVEKGGLGSKELLGWKDEMEAAVWDDSSYENVVKRSELIDAIEAVKVYIREERERFGPSFIQFVAHRLKDDGILKGLLGMGNGDEVSRNKENLHSVGEETDARNGDEVSRNQENLRSVGEETDARNGDEVSRNQENLCSVGEKTDARKRRKEVQKDKFHLGSNRAINHSRGVKVTDSDEMTTRSSNRDCELPDSAQTNKVRNALESSSFELQAVVKDPLPDVLRLADTISELAGKGNNHDTVDANHVGDDLLDGYDDRVVQGTVSNVNNVHPTSLMERKCSARTDEWNDSIDGSREDSLGHGGRIKLPNPRDIRVSPIKKYEVISFKIRRKNRRWTPLEEDTLRTAVDKYGKGNWKVILQVYPNIFEDRTEVDLKDKWRNLTRY